MHHGGCILLTLDQSAVSDLEMTWTETLSRTGSPRVEAEGEIFILTPSDPQRSETGVLLPAGSRVWEAFDRVHRSATLSFRLTHSGA